MTAQHHKLDVLAQIRPQMQAVLDKQQQLAGDSFATDVGFEQMRANYIAERAYWNIGGPSPARTEQLLVSTGYGPVRIRLYYPSVAETLPALVFLHGGGFVVGNLDTHNRIQRILSEQTGAVVVGVEYALSPEARFPQAIIECADVIEYVRAHAESLSIDVNRIGLAGDSGGASMCLATALYLRDERGDARGVDCLLLFYGLYGLMDSMTQRLYGGSWDGLTQEDLRYYLDCYVNGPDDLNSPYLNCLGADLSHGLPPTYLAAAGLDPLLDDSKTLAALLTECQVPCQLDIFDGVLHGFLHYTRMLDEANTAFARAADFFRTRGDHN